MGTVVLANLLMKNITRIPKLQKVSGIIYFAPAFVPKVDKMPVKEIMKYIYYIMLYPFNKGALRIYLRGNEENGSADPIHHKYDATDPIHLDYVSLRYQLSIKKYMDKVKKRGGTDVDCPLLAFFGEDDFIVDHKGTKAYITSVKTGDVKSYGIPSGKHALFTDPFFEEYWPVLRDWIRVHK